MGFTLSLFIVKSQTGKLLITVFYLTCLKIESEAIASVANILYYPLDHRFLFKTQQWNFKIVGKLKKAKNG